MAELNNINKIMAILKLCQEFDAAEGKPYEHCVCSRELTDKIQTVILGNDYKNKK